MFTNDDAADGLGRLPLTQSGQVFLLAAARLQAQAFKATMRYQLEMLRFLTHCYERDARLLEDIVSAEEFGDALEVMSDFVQDATLEYVSEIASVATIGSKLGRETARQMRSQVRDAIEDVAAKTLA